MVRESQLRVCSLDPAGGSSRQGALLERLVGDERGFGDPRRDVPAEALRRVQPSPDGGTAQRQLLQDDAATQAEFLGVFGMLCTMHATPALRLA
jgi:hypothetical protein